MLEKLFGERISRPKDMTEMKQWLAKTTETVNFSDLKRSHKARLCIKHNDIDFEAFFIPHKVKKLYVSLSTPGYFNKRYPVFTKNSWSFVLNEGMFLCIDDPTRMEVNYPVCFFFGKKDKSYISLIVDIVKKFAQVHDIKNEDICFIGSSVSGYGVLYCADAIPGAKCIALSPQVSIADWVGTLRNYGVNVFEKTFNVKFSEKDQFNRYDVYRILRNRSSKFFIYYNIYSKEDRIQIDGLFRNSGYTYKDGLQRIGNVWLLVTNIEAASPHAAIPDEHFVKIIEGFMEHDPTESDVNICNATISQMKKFYLAEKKLTEVEKQVEVKKNQYIQIWKNFLEKHRSGIPFFLHPSNEMGISLQFFLHAPISPLIHYEIALPHDGNMGIALHFEGAEAMDNPQLNELIDRITDRLKEFGFMSIVWKGSRAIRQTIKEQDFDILFPELVYHSYFDILLYKKSHLKEEFRFLSELSSAIVERNER